MKNIRNQKKYPIGVRLPMHPKKELRAAGIQFFYAVTKRTYRQQTKNQKKNLAENAFETVKTYYGMKMRSIALSLTNDKVLCDLSLKKQGNK